MNREAMTHRPDDTHDQATSVSVHQGAIIAMPTLYVWDLSGSR